MRCPKCGREQTGGSECVGCGVVFARDGDLATSRRPEPRATKQDDQRAAVEYRRRGAIYAWTVFPLFGAFVLALLWPGGSGPVVWVLGIGAGSTIVLLQFFLLRCPNCEKRVGVPGSLRCPHCDVVLRPVRISAVVHPEVVSQFQRRRLLLERLRRIERPLFMSAIVLFALLIVSFVSGRLSEIWTIGFWVIGALIGCGAIVELISRWHYRCPRCRKALFEDTGDSDSPLDDPEFCPFCGERLRGV
jgi:hypothetical protein